jgi:hypothetical protein
MRKGRPKGRPFLFYASRQLAQAAGLMWHQHWIIVAESGDSQHRHDAMRRQTSKTFAF